MSIVGTLLGVAIVFCALLMPSGNGEVSNLAAMNLKTNLTIAGAALFVGGIISDAAARMVSAINAGKASQAVDRAIAANIPRSETDVRA